MNKCDANEAKCILGYRNGKTYAAAAKNDKREETRTEQRERENTNTIEMGSGARAKITHHFEKHW